MAVFMYVWWAMLVYVSRKNCVEQFFFLDSAALEFIIIQAFISSSAWLLVFFFVALCTTHFIYFASMWGGF